MKKILFLSEINPNIQSGGSVIAKRDLSILKSHFSVEEIQIYSSTRNALHKIIDIFCSENPVLYSRSAVNLIKKAIKKSKCDTVFLENSLLGNFAKYASKYCNKKVVTYFQNCEYDLSLQCRSKIWHNVIYKLEKQAIDYSSHMLILNSRDQKALRHTYGYKGNNNTIIPISMDDMLQGKDLVCNNCSNEPFGLFIGSLFRPNENAVKFLIDELADELPIKIKVVGYNFENFNYKKHNKVEIIGTINDLNRYIVDAEFVIFPIWEGSGMKVKTCHAMMFGKAIFGTSEAFEGYELTNNMFVCNDKNTFLKSIKDYLNGQHEKFNQNIRDIWLKNYSNNIVERSLVNVIDNI